MILAVFLWINMVEFSYIPIKINSVVAQNIKTEVNLLKTTKLQLWQKILTQQQTINKLKAELTTQSEASKNIQISSKNKFSKTGTKIIAKDLGIFKNRWLLESVNLNKSGAKKIAIFENVYIGNLFNINNRIFIELPRRGIKIKVMVPKFGTAIATSHGIGSYSISLPKSIPIPSGVVLKDYPTILLGEVTALLETSSPETNEILITSPINLNVIDEVNFI